MSAANGDAMVVRLSDSVTIIHVDCRDVLPAENTSNEGRKPAQERTA